MKIENVLNLHFSLSFLKVLIVFGYGRPTACPEEAMGDKGAFAKVMRIDVMRNILGSVGIFRCSGRLNDGTLDRRVLQGVDIDRHAHGVT